MSALYQTQGQAAIWVLFALAGAAAALLTDLLISCAGRGPARILAGLLAGAATAAIAGAVCFLTTNGRLRLYMLLAMAGGAGLYRATLGALLHGVAALLLRLFRLLHSRFFACRFIQRLLK